MCISLLGPPLQSTHTAWLKTTKYTVSQSRGWKTESQGVIGYAPSKDSRGGAFLASSHFWLLGVTGIPGLAAVARTRLPP